MLLNDFEQSIECQAANWKLHHHFCQFASAKRIQLREEDKKASKTFGQACRLSAVIEDLASNVIPIFTRVIGLEMHFYIPRRREETVRLDMRFFNIEELQQDVRDRCLAAIPTGQHYIVLRTCINGQEVIRPFSFDRPQRLTRPSHDEHLALIVAALRRLSVLKR
ncbi:hypothetical protein M422DRAFT_257383 [Sphaerobolus stellatus SS14]|uniref:Uncharacterized protein n=1 Tax=Sphaerobolus stellatus (strain SS14) TaxID=990650 RepID=A0A0C9VPL1_SPHS4|nr:hypothetical protein M422DRAFT_257383 [Sphaerobolus stellatus SS14]